MKGLSIDNMNRTQKTEFKKLANQMNQRPASSNKMKSLKETSFVPGYEISLNRIRHRNPGNRPSTSENLIEETNFEKNKSQQFFNH